MEAVWSSGRDPEKPGVGVIVRVKMCRVGRPPNLHEHANNDIEKPADLWRIRILSPGPLDD